jgi:hypothetical protein
MRKLKAILFMIVLLASVSCGHDRLDVDTSNVKVNKVEILRMDNDLFTMDPAKIPTYTKTMQAKYGNFYSTFIFGVLNPGEVKDSAYRAVATFISDKDMKMMHADVNKIYTTEEMNKLSADLENAFKRFRYHFPARALPKKVVAFESGFNYNITTADSTLGIGLDMYLGADNSFYQMLQWPHYKTIQLRKEYIVSDAMKGWIVNTFDTNEPVNNLLNYMIFYGKLYYCMDAVLPETPDSVKIGYTAGQMKYCTTYEKKLWGHFTEKERLYKNDQKEIAEYTSEGPFTSAISKDCPPRIAMYVGWQIVRSYMNKNEKVSLEDLMKTTDAQLILTKSKYKP